MTLSKLTSRLMGQPMFKLKDEVSKLEQEGRKILHFEIGDSDFNIAQPIIDATKHGLDTGHTKYVNSSGTNNFKKEIIQYTNETLGFKPDMEQILVIPANAAIDTAIRCIMDENDKAIIPNPGFPTYSSVLDYLNFDYTSMNIYDNQERFYIDPQELQESITKEHKLLIMNSPNNPTGMVLTQEETQDLYSLAKKNDLFLLSDEAYSHLTYDDIQHYSPAIYDQCKERTILLNSFSKNFNMSGWRLGYVIGPAELIKKMSLLFETIYSCVPPFIQHAGISTLQNREAIVNEFKQLNNHARILIKEELESIPGVHCNQIAGSIYAFANINKTGLSDESFAKKVLQEGNVALLPGSNFGSRGEGYIRMCFSRNSNDIKKAIQNIKKVLKDS